MMKAGRHSSTGHEQDCRNVGGLATLPSTSSLLTAEGEELGRAVGAPVGSEVGLLEGLDVGPCNTG